MSVHTSMLMERNDLELLGYLNFWSMLEGDCGTDRNYTVYIYTHTYIYISTYSRLFTHMFTFLHSFRP